MILYTDNDPACCRWIGELMADGLIPTGEILEKDIQEVTAADLAGVRTLHAFAGIAGWAWALRLAGWPADRDCWTVSCPCFPAGTLIITMDGYKAIENVSVGDRVLTHTGRFMPVLQTGSEISPCVRLKGQGHWGMVCTPDHPFYTRDGDVETWRDAEEMRGHRWATVADLPASSIPPLIAPRKGCFFDSHLGKYRANGEKAGRKIHIGVFGTEEDALIARRKAASEGVVDVRGADGIDVESLEFAHFLGYWVGDGWTSGEMILLCGSRDDCDLLDGIFASIGLRQKSYLEKTSARIRCGSRHLVAWLNTHFGKSAHGKRLPLWLHGASPEYRKAFLEGYFLADGSSGVQKQGGGKIRTFATTSRALAVGIRVLLNQEGISASIRLVARPETTVIQGRKVNQLSYYKVTAYETARSFQFHRRHGWGVVRSVEPAGFQRVYNIAVAEDESYTADGLVVHNCPPFSTAGKKKACPRCGGESPVPCVRRTGFFICCFCEHAWLADKRHLWPEVWRLVRECRPATIFGEQVGGADGRVWFAGVRATLELLGYRVGAADLAAGSVSAPHIRQRLFWVAVADGGESRNGRIQRRRKQRQQPQDDGTARGVFHPASNGRRQGRSESDGRDAESIGDAGGMGDNGGKRCEGCEVQLRQPEHGGETVLDQSSPVGTSGTCSACPSARWTETPRSVDGAGDSQTGTRSRSEADVAVLEDQVHGDGPGWMGDPIQPGREGRGAGVRGESVDGGSGEPVAPAGDAGRNFWADSLFIPCRDGQWRRVPAQSEIQSLAPGISPAVGGSGLAVDPSRYPLTQEKEGRVILLRGAGNSIVPEVAAAFIRAFLDTESP